MVPPSASTWGWAKQMEKGKTSFLSGRFCPAHFTVTCSGDKGCEQVSGENMPSGIQVLYQHNTHAVKSSCHSSIRKVLTFEENRGSEWPQAPEQNKSNTESQTQLQLIYKWIIVSGSARDLGSIPKTHMKNKIQHKPPSIQEVEVGWSHHGLQ